MQPLVIAHRGNSAHRPENTLASFQSACELGAEIVELDVQMTRDRHVVVIHDPTLDRTTSGRGVVAELTLSELRKVSAGFPSRFGAAFAGERIPTLTEALAFLKDRTRVLLEIKKESVGDDAEDGIEARSVYEVRRAGMAEDVVLISFERPALLRCRRLAPEIPRGHLFARATPAEILAGAEEVGCGLVMPEKRLLTLELCDRAREAGLRVATWVVDEVDELKALGRFGIYGFGTNRPGEMLEALEAGIA